MEISEVLAEWWLYAFRKGLEVYWISNPRKLARLYAKHHYDRCSECGRELLPEEFCSCPQSRL
jgi:hypothetical protein